MSEPREPDYVIRASSLPTMFDCGARWKAIHLLGKRSPSGAPSLIGNGVHAGAAAFDQATMDGAVPHLEDAVDAAADVVRDPPYEVIWDEMPKSDAIDTAARLTLQYCNDIAPQFTYVAVESKCEALDIQATNGTVIRFTGTIDRKRVEGDKFGISDLKTGSRVVRADGSVNTEISGAQLATYELLELMDAKTSGMESILPALIVALPTSGKQRPTVAPIYNPHKVLIGDEQHKGLIDDAADMLKHDIFPGNPRSMLCSARYCPVHATCRYRFRGE